MRNTSLEGVRGAAALVVVLHHANFATLRGGYLSVDLFFVLSGFVICNAYGARLASGADWCSFMLRRFGRLWPTFIVATVLYYAIFNGVLALAGSGKSFLPNPTEAVALATMSQGLNLFNRVVGPGAGWSTSDEFYAYTLFSLLCLFMHGNARRIWFVGLAITGYAVALWASVGSAGCLAHGDCLALTFSFGWSRCLVGFFTGALLAEYRDTPALRALTGNVAQLGALAAAVLLMLFSESFPSSAFLAPITFAVLVASLATDSGPIARVFQAKIPQYLGAVSYSLYLGSAALCLWLGLNAASHTIGTKIIVGATYLAISLALAHVLHRFVETPCRRRFNAWAERMVMRSPARVSPRYTEHSDATSRASQG